MPKPIKRQRWSNIDVFGLINGISTWDPQYRNLLYVRGPADTPLDIRAKIFRQHDNPVGLTKQGLLNGISNEFGLDTYNVLQTNIFQLTNDPFPSGNNTVQDIWLEYREVNSTGDWTSVSPQVWGETYETYKTSKKGFIVWQANKYVNVTGIKNFNYSRTLEILEDLPDNQELRITYYIRGTDENNNLVLKRFSDVDNLEDPYTRYYVYRKPIEIDPTSGVTVYTLNDIPTGLFDKYYDSDNWPTDQLYTIKNHINSHYKHTWGTMTDSSVIWDVHKQYGSGNIPHFYDTAVPQNANWCQSLSKSYGEFYSGFVGGIDDVSHSLYLDQIIESGDTHKWFFTLYPGRFYLDGTAFYLFENPQRSGIVFAGGEATLPYELERGAHVILAVSGYYDNACTSYDEYLSGFVYEDHTYPVGLGGDEVWSYIYRRRGFIPSEVGYDISLELGEYNIDFQNRKVYANVLNPSAVIIWENSLIPSGRTIEYDINPLNNPTFSKQKFFLYLATKE